MRRLGWTCLALVLVACVLLSLAAMVSAFIIIDRRTAQPAPTATFTAETTAPIATTEPTPTSTALTTPTASPTSEIPDRTLRIMERLERETADLRQLPILQPVERVLYDTAQLQQRVEQDFLKDYTPEEAATDAQVLAAFGLIPPNTDLLRLFHDLYTEQIAGFYDDETKEMVVVLDGGFNGPERMTYVHEFTHALQDQHFHLRDPEGLNYNDEACEQDSERCAAIQALVEGDASFTEFLWFYTKATASEQRQIQSYYQGLESPVFDQAPLFIQKDLVFPYDQGLNFVQNLFSRGSWEAVNQAYAEPPVSTEQILHPERYPDDRPIPVTLPDLSTLLGNDWTSLDQGVFGEWDTFLLLSAGYEEAARLEEDLARQAAAGWGGDAYAVFRRSSDQALLLVLDTTWDSGTDRYEFADAFQQYATQRFGQPTERIYPWATVRIWSTSEGLHAFYAAGTRTLWVMAPDEDTLRHTLEALLAP